MALADSLKDKKELLQEVPHRAKNNLQLILSLVRIQFAQGAEDDLEKLRRRVRTLAVGHDQLAAPEDVRGIDARDHSRHSAGKTDIEILLDSGRAPFSLTVSSASDGREGSPRTGDPGTG